MYAMLTGNLPFTVEPFNIKSLYNKMMKNEMNPIPDHLSKSKDFFIIYIKGKSRDQFIKNIKKNKNKKAEKIYYVSY